jgi:superfamily II DNA or RNA helicase
VKLANSFLTLLLFVYSSSEAANECKPVVFTPGEASVEAFKPDIIAGKIRVDKGVLALDADRFFREHFIPVVGLRGWNYPLSEWKNGLEFPGYSGAKIYRVEFSDSDVMARVLHGKKVQTLIFPRALLDQQSNSDIIRKWLIGHPLHPFMVDPRARLEREALGEPSFFHRQVQLDAIQVGKTYLKRFDTTGDLNYQRFLYVAPTGTGKSLVYEDLLSERITQIKGAPGLIIVLSERANVVRDRYSETLELQRKLKGKKMQFDLVQWGGENENNQGIVDLPLLLSEVKNSKRPTVLLTTTTSFRIAMELQKTKMGQAVDSNVVMSNIALLKGTLRGIFVDEAHHLGARIISDTIQRLLHENNRVMIAGMTATPIHKRKSIQALFNNHGYWAYLDSPEEFLATPQPLYRDLRDISRQLRIAFDKGDIVGFEKIRIVTLIGDNNRSDIYIKRNPEHINSTYVLNPQLHSVLIAKISPVLKKKRGIIVANDIQEAEELTALIHQTMKDKNVRAEVITSKNAPAGSATEEAIMGRIKTGETTVLLSVQKLDEGINIHDAGFYVELNTNPLAKRFLQRVGRTTRVSPGKTETEVYLLSRFTEQELKDRLKEFVGESEVVTEDGEEYGVEDEAEDGEENEPDENKPRKKTGESVTVPIDRFLTAIETRGVETLNFWDDVQQYSSPAVDWSQSEMEDFFKILPKVYRGYSTKAKQFFVNLGEGLPAAARKKYLKDIDKVGLKSDFRKLNSDRVAALNRVAAAFKIYAEYRGIRIDGAITKDHFIKLGLWAEMPTASWSESDLENFLNFLPQVCDGYTRRSKEFFIGLDKGLTKTARQSYLKEIDKIGILDDDIRSLKQGNKPSLNRVVSAFKVYAQYRGIQIGGVLTRDHIIELGLWPESLKSSWSESEVEGFLNLVPVALRGYYSNPKQFFIDLATGVPVAKRQRYLNDVHKIGINATDYTALLQRRMTAVERLMAAFKIYAQYRGVQINGAITIDHMVELRLWKESSTDSWSQRDIDNFKSILSGVYVGYSSNASQYFVDLGKSVATNKRQDYLDDVKKIAVLKNDFMSIKKNTKPPLNRVVAAFKVYAQYRGVPIDGAITGDHMKKLELLQQ